MIFLTSLWTKFQGWIISVGAALALIAGVYAKGRSDSSKNAEAKQNKQRLDSINKSKEVSDEVRKMSPTDVDHRLDEFMRD